MPSTKNLCVRRRSWHCKINECRLILKRKMSAAEWWENEGGGGREHRVKSWQCCWVSDVVAQAVFFNTGSVVFRLFWHASKNVTIRSQIFLEDCASFVALHSSGQKMTLSTLKKSIFWMPVTSRDLRWTAAALSYMLSKIKPVVFGVDWRDSDRQPTVEEEAEWLKVYCL